MVSDQPGPFGVVTAVRVKSPSAAPNWWVVLTRRCTRRFFTVAPAASRTPIVNGWLWAIVAGAEVITGRSATSTYEASKRLLTGWYSCVVYTGLPCGSCPPASSTRPSNKVACDRYFLGRLKGGPGR